MTAAIVEDMCVTIATNLCHGDRALAAQQVKTVCPGLVKDAGEILEPIVHRHDSAGQGLGALVARWHDGDATTSGR